MEYPDPSKVHIYLCDDGNRPEIQKLAKQMNVGWLTREDRKGAKAGNLNNALRRTSSPLVVTFDADMIPRRRFLMETVPYFIDAEIKNEQLPPDKKAPLGFIQTPQAFYNPDLFQIHLYAEDLISNEQDYFFREIEPARTASNSVIYAGSNTILSRKALEDVGGFYTEAITEDFATGLLIEGSGYVSLALSQPLAFGLSPEDLPSLIQQRVRWGRGVINIIYQINIFFTARYSSAQKMNYWTSIFYWIRTIIRMFYLLIPIAAALFQLPIVESTPLQMLSFWIPFMLVNRFSLSILSGKVRSTLWSNIFETILCPFLSGPIFLEMIGLSLKTFKVTDKGKGTSSQVHWRYMAPFVILFFLDLAALHAAIRDIHNSGYYGTWVTLFWVVYNLFLLAISLLFMLGRKKNSLVGLRDSVISADLLVDDHEIPGVVVGLDEKEADFVFVRSVRSLISDKDYYAILHTSSRSEMISVRLHTVRSKEGLEVYRFQIVDVINTDNFLDIVYNRELAYQEANHRHLLTSEIRRILKARRNPD